MCDFSEVGTTDDQHVLQTCDFSEVIRSTSEKSHVCSKIGKQSGLRLRRSRTFLIINGINSEFTFEIIIV